MTSKTALSNELKRGVKKIRPEVIFESCAFWTNRLYRLKQRLWQLFNEINLHSFVEKKILYQIKKKEEKNVKNSLRYCKNGKALILYGSPDNSISRHGLSKYVIGVRNIDY